jgi:hypothetical protein
MQARKISTAPDFRDERSCPRRGRDPIGRYLWLARVIDKARAHANGTIGGYVYACPIDRGMLQRWGLSPAQFDEAVVKFAGDDEVLGWLQACTPSGAADAANEWLLQTWLENLDRQDREECAARS